MRTALLAGALLLLIGAPAMLLLLSTSSDLALEPDVSILGASTGVGVRVSNPHGIRALRVKLEQDSSLTTASVEAPADRWLFWKKREPATRFHVQIKADPRQGFRSGPARLTVETISNDFRGRTDVLTRDVQINLAPPALTVTGDRAYLTMGGAGLVPFRVPGYWTDAGVRVGNYEFRSYPVPGGTSESDRFCLFVFPSMSRPPPTRSSSPAIRRARRSPPPSRSRLPPASGASASCPFPTPSSRRSSPS